MKQCEDCDQLESKTYYHWVRDGIGFIYLDNASAEQFDDRQLTWFNRVIDKDADDKNIHTIVVGMHEALPWSISCDHSMNQSTQGTTSGVAVYQRLADLQKKEKDKKIYVLASHSHFFMSDIFNTKYWRDRGSILPGWIVGTAGAVRYPLPPGADLTKSRTNVYGYLLAKVYSDRTIDFEFTELKLDDIPPEIKARYTEDFVSNTCFAGNRQTDSSPEPDYCKANLAP